MKFKMGSAEIKAARQKPGGSNVGKKTFASGKPRTGPYAGPSGGAPKGSYPIPDKAHAKAAIKMSGHAPNPSGIKSAVYRKYPELKPDKKQAGTNSAKSFPDLNKDGKITKADILKGRGVIKKAGAKSMKVDEKMCGSKGMKYAEGTKSIKFKKPMMKRADGSYSQKGLWDNIRANKGSGKKPTPEMLKQEKKIKAKTGK
jgi:hypothetical protein